MDAGLAGLLGGVIGAAVGAVGAIASAVITGNKSERLARLQVEAQIAQAELQVRAGYAQQQVGTRIEAHSKLLDQLEKMLSRLDLNPQLMNSSVPIPIAQQVTSVLFADFEAIKSSSTTALVVGPQLASEKSQHALAEAGRAFAAWMLFFAGVLEESPDVTEWENMRADVVKARDAWREYASAVQRSLLEDGRSH
ncbi:hypothetical protein [Streptomyces sp. NPDC056660]|uniref:hypothetical protein n=1 Tax=Streptomyces sp. NPDC056660 TaxID=3345897 RepID=UPI0036A0C835